MSSVGQVVGGIVGGTVGFMLGGPAGAAWALRGAQMGIMVGGLIDPPKGPEINGPRLDDLSVQTSTYGAVIPRGYGTFPVVGNVFWLQGDRITEVRTEESAGGKGGPEQTINTWSYYATFAVGLCQGPIDGVRRIWIANQLWYDAGAGDLASIMASNDAAAGFTLYHGTDTQAADPLMQADKGVANVPAHRGLAYIVFDALPLEKYGNSLMGAQIKVEVVKDGALSYILQQEGSASTGILPNAIAISNNHAFVVNYSSATLTVYNIATHEPIQVGSVAALTTPTCVAVSGRYAYMVGGANTFRVFDVVDPQHPVLYATTTTSGFEDWIVVRGSYAYVSSQSDDQLRTYNIHDLDNIELFDVTTTGADPRRITLDNGHIYVVCDNSDEIYIYDVEGFKPVLTSTFSTDTSPRDIAIDDGYAYVVCSGSNTMQVFDVSDPFSVPAAVGSVSCAVAPISVSVNNGYAYVVTRNNSQLQVFDVHDPSAPSLVGLIVIGTQPAHCEFHDGMLYVVADNATIRSYLFADNRIVESTVPLSTIVQAECLETKLLTAGDLDVTDLALDNVRGYRVGQIGAIRSAIDPLRAAWPFDVVQHGYQIRFVRRGNASVATIDAGLLDAREAGAQPGVQITDVREMDLVLPREVWVKYLDVTREYDLNQQPASRINTDAVNQRTLDLPIVFNADEAKQTADMLLYLYWLERYDVAFVLPPDYSELEPADVITITSDDATYELRLTSANTLPDGRIECRAKYNAAAIYIQTSSGEEGQATGAVLSLTGPSLGLLLDIPLMRDADDTPGFPVAMCGYFSGWPGGLLYRSDDAGQTWQDLAAFGAPGAVVGYATGTLSSHGGTLLDKSSTLAVKLYSGSLSSVTEAQMFAGQNWFAYGAHGRWEIIAAQTCALQIDGSYILSDFMRGQHGTEWATGLHATNDYLVKLDASALGFLNVNASSIGSERLYRAITSGKALASASDQPFTYAGVNLECLSPVNLTGNRHPSTNDWTLAWTRRSRFVEWRDYVDARLGETGESYEIDIYADGTYATLKRTLTATTPTVAYTSAQQVTDFGSNQATLYVKVYQLSATVGRGYPLTTSITR